MITFNIRAGIHFIYPGLAVFNPIVITNSTAIVRLVSLVHQIRQKIGIHKPNIRSNTVPPLDYLNFGVCFAVNGIRNPQQIVTH